MDRNALESTNVSYEEVVTILSTQIGQLTAELLVTKAVLKKTQDLLNDQKDNSTKKADDF